MCFTVHAANSGLPSWIMHNCRYIVTDANNFSFNVRGPIVCPMSPLTFESVAEPPPLLTITSPVGRSMQTAVMQIYAVFVFHTRAMLLPTLYSRKPYHKALLRVCFINVTPCAAGCVTALGLFIREEQNPKCIGQALEPTVFQAIMVNSASFSAAVPAATLIFSATAACAAQNSFST